MDRRTFLKTMTQAAAVTAAAGAGAPLAHGSMPRRMTVAAVGDCIPARRISERRDPAFLEVVELLRDADCTWGNCETVFADPRKVYPAAKDLDPHCICEPWGADELAWMGIDAVGNANNHSMDWGYEGLFSTLENLERVGISHAGAGADLAAAARPGYADVAAGRVGQVNCASTFPPYFAGAPAHPYLNGRPGLNPLSVDYAVQVEEALYDRLEPLMWKLVERRGWGTFRDLLEEMLDRLPEGLIFLEETAFMKGDGFDLLNVANEADVERITQAVGVARNNARVVMATVHAHEALEVLERSAPFVEPFARATIDAGADMFFAAGPHVLRGIEIHNGKPIFYGLGNFIFQYESVIQPAESFAELGLDRATLDPSVYSSKIPYHREARFWQSVIPRITLEGGGEGEAPEVVSIELFPITLGFGEPIYRRGTPEMARGREAEEILAGLARLSEPYGTRITVEEGVGRVEL